jgi:hypothetical protein
MNPDTNDIAISLCYNPEECCQITGGADVQPNIPYEDLQSHDNTDLEAVRCDEQCLQIARDMFFMIEFVKNNVSPHNSGDDNIKI